MSPVRPLCPQQRTFELRSPSSRRFRSLRPHEQTYRGRPYRSESGYERTFSGPSTSVRFTLNFGHSRSEIALNAGLPRVGGRSEPKPLRSAFDPLRFPGDQAGAAPKCDVRPCPFHENH